MRPIEIYADSRRPGTCRSCGAAVEWATVVKSGNVMPFNPPIVATRVQLDLLGGSGRAIEAVDLTQTISHFATCPQAGAWRHR